MYTEILIHLVDISPDSRMKKIHLTLLFVLGFLQIFVKLEIFRNIAAAR